MAKKTPQHAVESVDDPVCIRYRDQNYRNHKAPGYNASGFWCQVHHILPCTSVSDSTLSKELTEDQYELIQNCIQITTWDINQADNCIGLPLRRAFHYQNAPSGWNGWPCHTVDHPAYNKEVITDLVANVWNFVSEKAEECEFDAVALEALLEERSEIWQDKLSVRGKRLKSTKYHWEHREELKDSWFVPFSMADPPQPRSAPKDISAALKKHLEKLYKTIGS